MMMRGHPGGCSVRSKASWDHGDRLIHSLSAKPDLELSAPGQAPNKEKHTSPHTAPHTSHRSKCSLKFNLPFFVDLG